MKFSQVLGIETSCDECSAAVVSLAPGAPQLIQVDSVETYSQIRLHQPFGGVVPEIASRNHLKTINPVIRRALESADTAMDEIDAIAVTNRPGLVGALLVGVSTAKTLAYVYKKPLIPVHHLEGHAASVFLDMASEDYQGIEYPLCLAIVSGGHTNLHIVDRPPDEWTADFLRQTLVGRSRDDAAGEAFDKIAKLLGFPYPGGKWIEKHAQGGNPHAFALPRALREKRILDFSFSGLKTAAALLIEELGPAVNQSRTDLCASVQEAIVEALARKIELAADRYHCKALAVVGGVAANQRLGTRLAALGRPVYSPPLEYCTDNAAMIGAAGLFRFQQGRYLTERPLLTLNAQAHSDL